MDLTSRRLVRPIWAALAAAALSTMTLAGAATAAPSAHLEEHFVNIVGVPITAPGASAYLDATHSSILGSDAGFQLWIEPELPWTGPPTYTSGRTDFTVGAGDSSLTGTFDLLDRDGAVVGIGEIDASLAAIGEQNEVKWPKSTGNFKHREWQTYQELIVGGSVTVTIGPEQIVLPLEGANAFAADYDVFNNAPAATVDWRTFTVLGFIASRGDIVVQVAMHEEGGDALSEAIVQLADQTFISLDDGSGTTFAGGRYGLDLVLQPSGEGNGIGASDAAGGTIVGSATIVPAERFAWVEDVDGARLRIAVQTYTLTGSFTVTFDDGTSETFSVDNRVGYAEQVTYRLYQPAD